MKQWTLILLGLASLFVASLGAQDNNSSSEFLAEDYVISQRGQEASSQEADKSADTKLVSILMEPFEDNKSWDIFYYPNTQYGTMAIFKGSPSAKVLDYDAPKEVPNDKVLGVKVRNLVRNSEPTRIIYADRKVLPGIVKSFSVWVDGRETFNRLSITIRDAVGGTHTIPLRQENTLDPYLNFRGWKRMVADVPGHVPQKKSFDDVADFMKVISLNIQFNLITSEPTDSPLYIYFDDLVVKTDISAQRSAPADDIRDNW